MVAEDAGYTIHNFVAQIPIAILPSPTVELS